MGLFDFLKNIFCESKEETKPVTTKAEEKPKSFGIVSEKREMSLKEHLQEQAKNTLELFTGIDEETKKAVLKKFESHQFNRRISKTFELEMFSLFEGKEFDWLEYSYLKKWSAKNGITTHWAGRFCKKETPLNIVRLFIWTAVNRAYDANAKAELKSAGFEKSDLLVDYENDLQILKRFKRLKTLPWKHKIHPIAPGLMCCRVCLPDDEKGSYPELLD